AADAHALRALAHASRGAGRALAATVGWLAADSAPDQATGDAAADLAHDAGVLMAEHERRLPRKQSLRGVDIGAADARGVDVDDDLPGSGVGLGGCVDREAVVALPGRDLHISTSTRPRHAARSVASPPSRAAPSSGARAWAGPNPGPTSGASQSDRPL